ncbi:MAG TPA: aldo/keto reductase [Anaerolineaceae bacterium]|nr:aldo/keto reductase [Anaerolineaceae bacterium]
MIWAADDNRYNGMVYNRVGRSGLKLPAVSLGLWHNFGGVNVFDNSLLMVQRAFDLGITHFDLANNYGPPYGSAEETFGQILKKGLRRYRDEMIISTKAGWDMWPGPYGNWGSRKYLVASLHQSLQRMGLEYVDIFYHHRPDPETPLEETLGALDFIVRSGLALYAGISQYPAELTAQAARIACDLGTPIVIHQPSYNMFDRWVERCLLDVLEDEGIGCIVFSPLAQGLLSEKYLEGIPSDSRAADPRSYLSRSDVTPEKVEKIRWLGDLAHARGQSISQMALAWCLRKRQVTSVLIGARNVTQIEQNVAALDQLEFTEDELARIEAILAG